MSNGEALLTNKVAVVTGGGTGIGRSIARLFAARGSSLGAARSRSRKWRGRFPEAPAAPTSPASRTFAALFELCRHTYGGLDVLVNNAGVIGPIAEASEMDMELWDEVMAVNVRGVALCTKLTATHASHLPADRRSGSSGIGFQSHR